MCVGVEGAGVACPVFIFKKFLVFGLWSLVFGFPYGCERACQSARAFGNVGVAGGRGVCRCACAG